ncbi:hypothetical protein AB0P04_39550, partial [Streptomyces anulatus]
MTVGTLSAVVSAGPASAEPAPAYDHSKDKGIAPGTHGPLPKGFSTTQLSVKFKPGLAVRVRDHGLVARDTADAAEIQRVLAKYKGASIRPLSSVPEAKVTQQRLQLEQRTGRATGQKSSSRKPLVYGAVIVVAAGLLGFASYRA